MPKTRASTLNQPEHLYSPLRVSEASTNHYGSDSTPVLRWAHQESLYAYFGDCLSLLSQIGERYPDGAFDLIFADPPYFLSNGGITCKGGRMVSVDKGKWDKSSGPDADHEFNRTWLRACQAALKPNGSIWVSGTSHVIHSVGFAMQQLGFKILNNITWEKPNPPPNLSCRYFTHSAETIIWAAKTSKSKHKFNYDVMRRENLGKQMKSVWRLAPPESWEKRIGKHPTQKPVRLLRRILEATSDPGDLVFDPFMGSGTTGIASVLLKRRFVGIESDPTFVELAIRRMQHAAVASPGDFFATSESGTD
jgi:site-specific DNA-methyltransferase (adenine-specific)